MYSEKLESLIEAILADGEITDQERAVLRKQAQACGEDPDEVIIVLEGRLAKIKKASAPAIPAVEKRGNVVKCPSCGAPVESGAVKCAECGYEFTNVKVNSTAQRFAEELAKTKNAKDGGIMGVLDKDHKVASFIENYPVPNSIDDLSEMLILTKQNADRHGSVEQVAYWKLYGKCVEKAKNSGLETDSRFAPFFEHYKKHGKKKNLAGWIAGIAGILIIGGLIGVAVYFMNQRGNAKDEIAQKITAQMDSLSALIDGLPVPTADNYAECAYNVSKLVWKPVNCQFNDGRGGDDVKALEKNQADQIRAFVQKKNAYIDLLNSLHVADPIPHDSYENYISQSSQDVIESQDVVDEKSDNAEQPEIDPEADKKAVTELVTSFYDGAFECAEMSDEQLSQFLYSNYSQEFQKLQGNAVLDYIDFLDVDGNTFDLCENLSNEVIEVSATLKEVTLDGNTAVAKVKVFYGDMAQTVKVNLIKEANDEWKIDDFAGSHGSARKNLKK